MEAENAQLFPALYRRSSGRDRGRAENCVLKQSLLRMTLLPARSNVITAREKYSCLVLNLD